MPPLKVISAWVKLEVLSMYGGTSNPWVGDGAWWDRVAPGTGDPNFLVFFTSTPGPVSAFGLSSGVLILRHSQTPKWSGTGTYSGCSITMRFANGINLEGKLQVRKGVTEILWANGVTWTRRQSLPSIRRLCSRPAPVAAASSGGDRAVTGISEISFFSTAAATASSKRTDDTGDSCPCTLRHPTSFCMPLYAVSYVEFKMFLRTWHLAMLHYHLLSRVFLP